MQPTTYYVICCQKYYGSAAGCTLPVEMFFPAREFPIAALEGALADMGVVCRPLPDLDLLPSTVTDTETDLSGFTMKVAALLLSRFQEVRELPQSIAPLHFSWRAIHLFIASKAVLK